MDKKEIETKATELEKLAESSAWVMAEQLHDMSPEDRLAVAKQIRWNQQQHPSDSLPKIDFFDDGDVKTVARKTAEGAKKEDQFDDATGKLTFKRVENPDGTTENYDYESNTRSRLGPLKSYDRENADGSTVEKQFDPKTGNLTVETTNDKRGNRETATYDPTDGRLVASDIVFKDKSVLRLVFDENKKIKEVDTKDKDGNINHWKRDSQSQNGTRVKDIQNPYPLTGLEATEVEFKDGTKVHLSYDSMMNVTNLWTKDYTRNKDVDLNYLKR